mmetsp:Transcript_25219/g.62487  ORF Transcript_25219/g.62487 Transcript_25219/m.62487 type:complete len:93 (+) Transcript_25219:876-1154(+)
MTPSERQGQEAAEHTVPSQDDCSMSAHECSVAKGFLPSWECMIFSSPRDRERHTDRHRDRQTDTPSPPPLVCEAHEPFLCVRWTRLIAQSHA